MSTLAVVDDNTTEVYLKEHFTSFSADDAPGGVAGVNAFVRVLVLNNS